jgi:arabinose-5-phosphate isomerase
MRTGAAIPLVKSDASFLEMMEIMSNSGLGVAITADEKGAPIGIFTDGDLRRELSLSKDPIHQPISRLMRKNPKTIHEYAMAVDAVSIMEEQKITSIIAVNHAGQLVGILNTNDLLRAKVI